MIMARFSILFYLIFVFFQLCMCMCNVLAEEQNFSFSLEDYIYSKQRREIAFEFFDYFQNSTETSKQFAVDDVDDDAKCLSELGFLVQGLTQRQLWAFKFLDAWGTIPAGILEGNVRDLGNYDECLGISKEIRDDYFINGKYCFAQLPIGNMKSIGPISIQVAICMPASCSSKTIDTLLQAFLQRFLGLNFNSETTLIKANTCQTKEREPLEPLAIVTIVLLSVLCALMLCATLYDYFLFKNDAKMHPLICAFSARANGRVLFRVVDQSKNPNVIPCLHGIRCMSLIWVVLGHCYYMALMLPNINVVHAYLVWAASPFAMLIEHSNLAVETFFFLSGLLLVMVALRDMNKKSGKLNVPLMYLHRFLRLTPMVGMAILVYMSLLSYMGNGPLWNSYLFDNYENCRKHWWETLLYVQNYATKEICVAHTWYLAVDTQLYFLSPLLLIPLWRWGKRTIAATFLLMLLLSACLFTISILNDYSLFWKTDGSPNSTRIYFGTHTRAAPWLIGIMFGYYLHVTKGKTITLSRFAVWFGWLSSLALIFTCIFALYPQSQLVAAPLTILEEAFYNTLTRIAWPLALCWIVFACVNGYGGLANSFLSSPLWQPLSKLSYCAYIWHILPENVNAARVRTSTYFTDYDVILRFWADFGITLLLSVFMYLIIEAPMAGVEMLLLPNRRRTSKSTSPFIESVTTPKTPPKNESAESAEDTPIEQDLFAENKTKTVVVADN